MPSRLCECLIAALTLALVGCAGSEMDVRDPTWPAPHLGDAPPRDALVSQRGPALQARSTPQEVGRQRRLEQEHDEAVVRKLDEYERWAMALVAQTADPFHRAGVAYLVTDSPLLRASREALAKAVLDWAYSHTADPDFPRKSPSEVALYLLAKNAALSRLLLMGDMAHAHLDYSPELDPSVYTTEELLIEMLVGFIPGVGDAADMTQALAGVSITGHRLEPEDRTLLAVGAMIPLVPGSALRRAQTLPEVVERLALVSGRRTEEVEALLRVASRLGAEDSRELERIVHVAAKGRALSSADLESLEKLAGKLGEPLARAAETLRQAGRASGLGLKVDLTTGRQLVPGSAEHMYQRWIDYQFRYPGKRGVFTLAVDPEWERLYRTILENAETGGKFQEEALAALKFEKNTAMMMPPPGSTAKGFIPDAVKGNPTELVWGQKYDFVEVKAREELSNSGNLKAMLEYVKKVDGATMTLVVRSAKHPKGETKMTGPLEDLVNKLREANKLNLKSLPE